MKYNCNKMREFASAIMQKNGLSKQKSDLFAESLIAADMRGITSHGVTRLKTYAYRLEAGLVDAHAETTIIKETPALILMDANNGLGVPAAMDAMKLCVEKAKTIGCCFAAVKGGNHFGMGEFFTDYAAQNGMIGIAMTNGPAALAPIGGKKAILGTNPLAVSVPSEKYRTVSLDMATSVVARGKVTLAKKNGKKIPEGWAIDKDGHSTTDPNKVSCMLPFGGAKGYGIGLLIELMCCGLAGAKSGLTMGSFYDFSGKKQDVGYFENAILYGRTIYNNILKFIKFQLTINVGAVVEEQKFKEQSDVILTSIKESPRAEDCDEIYLPGEIELNRAEQAQREGMEISDVVVKELEEISMKYKVPFN